MFHIVAGRSVAVVKEFGVSRNLTQIACHLLIVATTFHDSHIVIFSQPSGCDEASHSSANNHIVIWLRWLRRVLIRLGPQVLLQHRPAMIDIRGGHRRTKTE